MDAQPASPPVSRSAGGACERNDAPRERLRSHGVAALSNTELVALLLRTGSADDDALSKARALLAAAGGLRALANAAAAEIATCAGVGPVEAASIAAALELGRRVATHRLERGAGINGPEEVHRHFHARLRDARCECFMVLLLDGRHRLIEECLVSQGTLTASLVHPREVFRAAIRAAAAAVVLVHNHPSGDPQASDEDRRITRRLARAGELIGIRVLDHVIVAEHGYFSFVETGELEGPDFPRGSG